jgi:hypothetical protein
MPFQTPPKKNKKKKKFINFSNGENRVRVSFFYLSFP